MIPKLIHQLWIGPKPIPDREAQWCAEMSRMNPGWQYRLHGNELLERYADDPYVKHLQLRKSPLAFLSDRLRCLLLRDEGGVYLDTDCQPVRPLDTLTFWSRQGLDFVYGLRNPWRPGVALHRGIALVDNTMMASAPDGRLIRHVLTAWQPQEIEVTGHRIGTAILSHSGPDCIALNYRSFYDLQITPDTIALHDGHNLGSWVKAKIPVVERGEVLNLQPHGTQV